MRKGISFKTDILARHDTELVFLHANVFNSLLVSFRFVLLRLYSNNGATHWYNKFWRHGK